MSNEGFVMHKEEFFSLKSRLFDLIKEDISFENNPFKPSFKYFVGIEFDMVFYENIFEVFKKFQRKLEIPYFVFYVLDPDPETYFYHYFQKFNVVKVGEDMLYNDFLNVLDSDPGGSPADALNVNSNEVAMFSSDDNWVMIGSREWEMIIVGFTNSHVRSTFVDCFSKEDSNLISSIKDHVDDLDKMLNFSEKTREAYSRLVKNYEE